MSTVNYIICLPQCVEDREGGRNVEAPETRGEREAGEQAEERAPRPSLTEKTNDHPSAIQQL